jgi:hypothetical protein
VSDQSILLTLQEELTRVIRRYARGYHRVVRAEHPASVIAQTKQFAQTINAQLYLVNLQYWLEYNTHPFEVLLPYTSLVRRLVPSAIVIVIDGWRLFSEEQNQWRSDPLASRLFQRMLLASHIPTLWYASNTDWIGELLTELAPERLLQWENSDSLSVNLPEGFYSWIQE